MRTRFLLFLLCALCLAACGGKKDRAETKSQLISEVEGFGADTVRTDVGNILCNADVDDILRHYPELYYAVKTAKKGFGQWSEQEKKAGLASKTVIKDFDSVIADALFNTDIPETGAQWPNTLTADSLYLSLIAKTKDIEQKNEVGKAYKAWQAYMEGLYGVMKAMPDECRLRFVEIVAGVSDKQDENLRKCVTKK